MNIQDEIEIIASTFDNTCAIYRPTLKTLDSGESVFKDKQEGTLIYKDLSCSLCSPSGGKLSYNKPTYKVPTDDLLFVKPDIDIQANDYLVIDQYGHEVIARAGRTDYCLSHNEVHVILEGNV